MNSFKDLGLSQDLLQVISELGFSEPTDIQQKAIPYLISENRDFIGLAQTGTGKTAAFGLPLMDRVDPGINKTQALILSPTRELGQQIAEQLFIFSKYKKGINTLAVYGGAPISGQLRSLKKTRHVIIATPGRLIDLIKRKAVNIKEIEYLVLDEADEMLNMGFKDELDEILSHTSSNQSTWLFSATMPKEIKRIVNTYMTNAIEVEIDKGDKVNTNIEHRYAVMKGSNKTEALCRFIDLDPEMRGVVFCRTKRDTQQLAEKLMKSGYKSDAIHGDLSQNQRDRVMSRFKKNELQLLIATDVAARGIDVNDLTHVFHYALPDDAAYYTHRSGRTARAGKKGMSIAFISGREKGNIEQFKRSLKIEIDRIEIPKAESIVEAKLESWCQSVMEQKPKQNINSEWVEQASVLFGGLSKDELLAKVLSYEFNKIVKAEGKDLNEQEQKASNSKKKGGFRGKSGGKRGNFQGGRSGGSKRAARKRRPRDKR